MSSPESVVAKPDVAVPVPAKDRATSPLLVRIGLSLAAVALLLVAARLPIWGAKFSAPQYPEGLRITAYGGKVTGDLGEINELSHYIGMPPFDFVGMPEMRLWPLIILVTIVAAVLAVMTRRRWLRRLACAGLWLTPVGALVDVQFRLWQTGHSIDPTAAIRVPPFTPRVVGPTTVMNFTINALPGLALILIVVVAALVTFVPQLVQRHLVQRQTHGSEPVAGAEPDDNVRNGAEPTATELKVP